MKFFLIVVFALFNLTGIAIADDAPFGLSWGMTVKELQDKGIHLEKGAGNNHFQNFKTESLPQNISIAKNYILIFSKKYNLQKLAMVSKTITDDIYGSEGKKTYERIKKSLSEKYGPPYDTYEYIGAELYDESDEFYQCLSYSGCGSWISFFKSKEGVQVTLELAGLSRGKGYLKLIYEGQNWTDALDEYRQDKSKTDSDAL